MLEQLIADLLYPDNETRRAKVAQSKQEALDAENKMIDAVNHFNHLSETARQLVRNNAILTALILKTAYPKLEQIKPDSYDLPEYTAPFYIDLLGMLSDVGLGIVSQFLLQDAIKLCMKFDLKSCLSLVRVNNPAAILEMGPREAVIEMGLIRQGATIDAVTAVAAEGAPAEVVTVAEAAAEVPAATEAMTGLEELYRSKGTIVLSAAILVIMAAVIGAQEKKQLEENIAKLSTALDNLNTSNAKLNKLLAIVEKIINDSVAFYNPIHSMLMHILPIEATGKVFAADKLTEVFDSMDNVLKSIAPITTTFSLIRNAQHAGLDVEANLDLIAKSVNITTEKAHEYFELLKKLDNDPELQKLAAQIEAEAKRFDIVDKPSLPAVFFASMGAAGGSGAASHFSKISDAELKHYRKGVDSFIHDMVKKYGHRAIHENITTLSAILAVDKHLLSASYSKVEPDPAP